MTIILIHSVLVHGEEILGVHWQLIDMQMNKIQQKDKLRADSHIKVKCSGHVAKSHSTPVINKRLLNLQEVRKWLESLKNFKKNIVHKNIFGHPWKCLTYEF